MRFNDIIQHSFDSIRINKSRTVVTCLIIGIGIMALVGILTAMEAMKVSMKSSFSDLGANSFSIKNRSSTMRVGGKRMGQQRIVYLPITDLEAERFKTLYEYPAYVSISTPVAFNLTVKSPYAKSNPDKQVIGVDELYFDVSGYSIENGRNFSMAEVRSGSPVAIIGSDLVSDLFKNVDPIGKVISAGNIRATVIGTLKSKGSGFGRGEGQVYLPLAYAKTRLQGSYSYAIAVQLPEGGDLDAAAEEAEGVFRRVRKIPLRQEDNFEVSKSNSLDKNLAQIIGFFTIAALVIGFITILGSAIGLMNIMLVTVTERTREIGIRKSIGARPNAIRKQFLYEAIVICLIGGLSGIVMGIVAGNLVSSLLGSGFLIPWNWIALAFAACLFVGVVAGYYPAKKASELDPIEALRAE